MVSLAHFAQWVKGPLIGAEKRVETDSEKRGEGEGEAPAAVGEKMS